MPCALHTRSKRLRCFGGMASSERQLDTAVCRGRPSNIATLIVPPSDSMKSETVMRNQR